MDYIEAAMRMLGRTGSSQGARHVTNAHAVTGTAVGDSEGGTVLVDLGGDVTSGDGSQYVEVQTDANVVEGDRVDVLLVGESGHGMSPVVYGVPGGGDRMAAAVQDAHDLAASVESIAQEAKDVAEATGQNFWPDSDGVHVTQVTKDEWNDSTSPSYHSGANVLLNALGQLFRDGLNNLLAIVTGTSPAIAIYDGNGNDADNILAEFASDHVRIGGDVPDGTGVESTVQFFDQTETHDTDMTASTYFDGASDYQTMQSTVNLSSTLADEGKTIDTGSSGTAALDLVNMLENGISDVGEQHNEVHAALVADASYSDGATTSHAAVRATATTTNGSHLSHAELIGDALGIGTSENDITYVPTEQAIASLTTPLYSNTSSVAISTANTDITGPSVTVPAGAYIIVVAYSFPAASGSGTRVTTVGYKPGNGAAQYNTYVQGSRAAVRLSMFNIVHITAQTSFTAYVRSDQTSGSNGMYIGMTRIS